VTAKDKKVLKDFSQFISKLQLTPNFLRSLPKQNLRKFITVLKSPHVNKTAQEQFEFRIYTKEFVISSFKPLTLFSILKKINNLSFSGLNLKIKSLFKKNTKKKLTALNPDSVNLNTIEKFNSLSRVSSFNVQNSLPSKRYIQLFDCYGEITLKTDFH
jgi:ribosomal protein S10